MRPSGRIVRDVFFPTFSDADLQRELEVALTGGCWGAADLGELAATAARIADGDADGWVLEWTAVAGAAWADANAADRAGRRAGARGHYLRAATFYATALAAVARSSEPERRLDLWRRQRTCWDRAVARSDPPAQWLALPYEDTSLPGCFFPAPDAAPGERRATVIVSHGGDGPTSQALALGGAAAAQRGHHWMTFDSPGREAALVEQGLALRADAEAVLTPVIDALVARDDVDPARLALIGIGEAGYAVPRALAFEHRLAAAAADPGVVDVSARWLATLPAPLADLLRRGDRAAFERELHLAELFSPTITTRLQLRGAAFGLPEGGAASRLYDALTAFRLGDEVAQITTPLLITDPEREPFWPGQSQQLFDRLPGPKRLVGLHAADRTSAAGISRAAAQRDSHIFDWLDAHLSSAAP
jgi:hypothetical protein